MEAVLKRYTSKGGSYYFTWNFAAGIAYEEFTGDVIDNAKTTRELAAMLYYGTIEGMAEVKQPFEMSFEDFTHAVGMEAIQKVFADVAPKKKRWRIWKRDRLPK